MPLRHLIILIADIYLLEFRIAKIQRVASCILQSKINEGHTINSDNSFFFDTKLGCRIWIRKAVQHNREILRLMSRKTSFHEMHPVAAVRLTNI